MQRKNPADPHREIAGHDLSGERLEPGPGRLESDLGRLDIAPHAVMPATGSVAACAQVIGDGIGARRDALALHDSA